MPDTVTGKIERKYMGHFLDSAFTAIMDYVQDKLGYTVVEKTRT